jgi:hypothetical protein
MQPAEPPAVQSAPTTSVSPATSSTNTSMSPHMNTTVPPVTTIAPATVTQPPSVVVKPVTTVSAPSGIISQTINVPKAPVAPAKLPVSNVPTMFPIVNTALTRSGIVVGMASAQSDGSIMSNGVLILGAKMVTGLKSDQNNKIYSASGLTSYKYIANPALGVAKVAVGTLYDAISYKGNVKALTIGDSIPKLSAFKMDKVISSLSLSLPCCVMMYDQEGFGGNVLKVLGPAHIPNFKDIDFNDRVRSLKVIPVLGDPLVTLDAGMGSNYVIPVDSSCSDLRRCGFPLNKLVSIRIASGVNVTLHSGLSFAGTSINATSGSVVPSFKNRAQSLKMQY